VASPKVELSASLVLTSLAGCRRSAASSEHQLTRPVRNLPRAAGPRLDGRYWRV